MHSSEMMTRSQTLARIRWVHLLEDVSGLMHTWGM